MISFEASVSCAFIMIDMLRLIKRHKERLNRNFQMGYSSEGQN